MTMAPRFGSWSSSCMLASWAFTLGGLLFIFYPEVARQVLFVGTNELSDLAVLQLRMIGIHNVALGGIFCILARSKDAHLRWAQSVTMALTCIAEVAVYLHYGRGAISEAAIFVGITTIVVLKAPFFWHLSEAGLSAPAHATGGTDPSPAYKWTKLLLSLFMFSGGVGFFFMKESMRTSFGDPAEFDAVAEFLWALNGVMMLLLIPGTYCLHAGVRDAHMRWQLAQTGVAAIAVFLFVHYGISFGVLGWEGFPTNNANIKDWLPLDLFAAALYVAPLFTEQGGKAKGE
uniref:Uncharacterized protein n=1 Tax=Bicosoecida sp. CB-2014 TaxID=1486930 RepID=A0A7S1CGW3_9STRA